MIYLIVFENIVEISSFMESITGNFPSKKFGSSSIFIESSLTSQQILSKLDSSGGTNPSSSIVISPIGNFYGRLPTEIWDWLKEKNPDIITEEKT